MASRNLLPAAIVVTAAVVGFIAIYVTLGGGDNAARQVASTTTPAQATNPGKLNVGQVTGFVFKTPAAALEPVAFKDGAGKDRSLADWKGRVVLLNLWATWCAPCRKEMPGLARLQAEMGSKEFEVLALAVDRGGAEKAQAFLDQVKASSLKLYIDETARTTAALRVVGMPTTILLDRQGREVGRLTGPAEWDTPEAKRLIKAVIEGKV